MPRYRRDHLRMVEKHLSASERERAEYAKDAWHADNIASARIPDTSNARWIHFEKLPERFRPTVKQWGQFLLARFSFSNCIQRIHFLQEFLNWLVASSPTISCHRAPSLWRLCCVRQAGAFLMSSSSKWTPVWSRRRRGGGYAGMFSKQASWGTRSLSPGRWLQ